MISPSVQRVRSTVEGSSTRGGRGALHLATTVGSYTLWRPHPTRPECSPRFQISGVSRGHTHTRFSNFKSLAVRLQSGPNSNLCLASNKYNPEYRNSVGASLASLSKNLNIVIRIMSHWRGRRLLRVARRCRSTPRPLAASRGVSHAGAGLTLAQLALSTRFDKVSV